MILLKAALGSAPALTTPPLNEVSCKLDGALQTTFANGEPVGVIAVVVTAPAAETGMTAVPAVPATALLTVQAFVTVAVMLMSWVAVWASAELAPARAKAAIAVNLSNVRMEVLRT